MKLNQAVQFLYTCSCISNSRKKRSFLFLSRVFSHFVFIPLNVSLGVYQPSKTYAHLSQFFFSHDRHTMCYKILILLKLFLNMCYKTYFTEIELRSLSSYFPCHVSLAKIKGNLKFQNISCLILRCSVMRS